MSAFIVGTVHIDALRTAGLAWCTETSPLTWHYPSPTAANLSPVGRARELTTATAGRVGTMLLAENARSADHRYGDNEFGTGLPVPSGPVNDRR